MILQFIRARCLLAAILTLPAISVGAAAPDETPEQIIQKVYASMQPHQEQGFERLDAPKAAHWRSHRKETPQTFEHYQLSRRIYPTPERFAIVLLPLGPFEAHHEPLLEKMREFAEAYFQLPARLETPLDLDAATKDLKLTRVLPAGRYTQRYQYNAGKILDDFLLKRLPADAAIYVAITPADLFFEQTGVLGLASMQGRVAICSLHQFFAKPNAKKIVDAAVLKRVCKMLGHEIGHTFSLGHCLFYRCAMNGCNGLAEAETAPLHLCPVCHQKLLLNNGIDALKRYRSLEAFYRKHGITDEADWVHARMKGWKE